MIDIRDPTVQRPEWLVYAAHTGSLQRIYNSVSRFTRKFNAAMTKRYHADLPSWILIGGISCLPCLLLATQVYDSRHPDPATLILFIGTLGFSAFTLTWLAAFRIELTPTEVTYRRLFSGTQNIRTDQIKKIRLHRVYSDKFGYRCHHSRHQRHSLFLRRRQCHPDPEPGKQKEILPSSLANVHRLDARILETPYF